MDESRATKWRNKKRKLAVEVQLLQGLTPAKPTHDIGENDPSNASEENANARCTADNISDNAAHGTTVKTMEIESSYCEGDRMEVHDEVTNSSAHSPNVAVILEGNSDTSTFGGFNEPIEDRERSDESDAKDGSSSSAEDDENDVSLVQEYLEDPECDSGRSEMSVDCEDLENEEDPLHSDQPSDSVNSDSDTSNSSDDIEDTLNFDDASLNLRLQSVHDCTVREALVLDLALAIRHNWTYSALIDSLSARNAIFGANYFPTTTRALWKVLHKSSIGIKKYPYCSNETCLGYLGRINKLKEVTKCSFCGQISRREKVKWFVGFSLKNFIRTVQNQNCV